jgi:hypothetical protein
MNDGGLPCFLILIGIAIVLAIAWWNRSHSRDLQQAFISVARWYHGRMEKRGWLGMPSVRIPYNHADVDVGIGIGDNGRKCTQSTVEWPEFEASVRVFSNQFGMRTFAKRGSVKSGDAEWDRLFTIESLNPDYARTLITGGVRSAILMLSRIRKSGGVDVRFGGGELVVQKLMVLDQASELSAFVRHTMEIFDQACLARTTGIEFVDTDLHLIQDAKCPICGDLIEDDLVFCCRCKTPHHRECWQYNGKCATYACGEMSYAAPRVGK